VADTHHEHVIRGRVVALCLALLAALSLVTPAGARDDEVRRRGSCSLGSEWRLIARRETRTTLRVRYVLDTDRAGEAWRIFLSLNGRGLFSGSRTTNANGYIRITRFPTDRVGDDLVSASANGPTGEKCAGSLVFPF
jgi:hypothetical protein